MGPGSEALDRGEAEEILKEYRGNFGQDGDPLRRRGPDLACSACKLAAKRFQSKVASKIKGKMSEDERRKVFHRGIKSACSQELFPHQMAVVEKESKEFYVDFQEALGSQHGRVSVKGMSPEIKADAMAGCEHVLKKYDKHLLKQVLSIPKSGRGSDLDFGILLCGRNMAHVCDDESDDDMDEL